MLQPLKGKKILLTRSREQASELSATIEALGGIAIHFPVIEIVAPEASETIAKIDHALRELDSYNWILFTSVNGVEYFLQHMLRLGLQMTEIHARIAAVGPKTAESLWKSGLVAKVPPSFYQAEGLFAAIQSEIHTGDRILIPTSNLARTYLQEELSHIGAQVTRIHVYENRLYKNGGSEVLKLLNDEEIDMITLTSSSTARNLFTVLQSLGAADPLALLRKTRVFCIGHKTAETVIELGINEPVIAQQATTEHLIAAMVKGL